MINLTLSTFYSELVEGCFLNPGRQHYKQFMVKFFTGNNFPAPSAKIFKAIETLSGHGVFLAGAMLTGTFAYRLYYAAVAQLPPKYFHSAASRKAIRMGKWNGDTLSLICRPDWRPRVVAALCKTHGTKLEGNCRWHMPETGITVTLHRQPRDPVKRELLYFLARDQYPAVICSGFGLPVAAPHPSRMAVYRLCSAVLRKSPARKRRDRALACDLAQYLRKNYFVEMFEQLAEKKMLGGVLRDALDAGIPEEWRDECAGLLGSKRLTRKRLWKQKKSDMSLFEKVAKTG